MFSFGFRRAVRAAAAVALTAGLAASSIAIATGPAFAAEPTVTDACIDSVPEAGETTPVQICFTLFQPADADSASRMPVVLQSHGWGGTRTTTASSFTDYLDAGIGVLSFDQRGHGESTGFAHLQDPAYEGVDLRRLVKYAASLDWVLKDKPGDPRIGAIGGSYGGGYQYLAALEHQRKVGKPVLDAIAPMSTWWSLPDSLGPAGLARTLWLRVLTATGGMNLEPPVLAATVEAGVTGELSRESTTGGVDLADYLRRSGGAWQAARGVRITIPTLIGSGTTDNLFPLQQGLQAWREGLTKKARKRSMAIGYNGGHNLPQLYPYGSSTGSDPCSVKLGSPDYDALAFRFMRDQLLRQRSDLRGYGKVHMATFAGECRSVRSVNPTERIRLQSAVSTGLATGTTYTPLADGPLRLAGRPLMVADVTTGEAGSRAFYGLAVGTSPQNATVVQNQMIPIHEDTAVGSVRRSLELPSVAVDVPEGQSLYLVAAPVVDMFAGTSSLQPGTVTLDRVSVRLPIH